MKGVKKVPAWAWIAGGLAVAAVWFLFRNRATDGAAVESAQPQTAPGPSATDEVYNLTSYLASALASHPMSDSYGGVSNTVPAENAGSGGPQSSVAGLPSGARCGDICGGCHNPGASGQLETGASGPCSQCASGRCLCVNGGADVCA